MRPTIRLFLIVTLFAIAMGYLESAVVIYIRALMYPEGFDFPLVEIEWLIVYTEVYREIATIIMLIGIGYLAGKSAIERFAWFIYTFGVWDIFYYVFLKVIIDWPDSLLTWDVLFLIPATWTAPVLAPIIVAFTFIPLALVILTKSTEKSFALSRAEWVLLIAGSLVLTFSFMLDFGTYVLRNHSFSDLWTFRPGKSLFNPDLINYVPDRYNWWIYAIGESMLLVAIVLAYRRKRH